MAGIIGFAPRGICIFHGLLQQQQAFLILAQSDKHRASCSNHRRHPRQYGIGVLGIGVSFRKPSWILRQSVGIGQVVDVDGALVLWLALIRQQLEKYLGGLLGVLLVEIRN